MKFSEFVEGRMEPFAAMKPPNGCLYQDMAKPLRDLLIELAGIRPAQTMSSMLAWLGTTEGDRVSAVCRECATFDEVPALLALRATWHRMFPPSLNIAKPKCEYCGGSGWEVREVLMNGVVIEGALRCRCGGFPPPMRAV